MGNFEIRISKKTHIIIKYKWYSIGPKLRNFVPLSIHSG